MDMNVKNLVSRKAFIGIACSALISCLAIAMSVTLLKQSAIAQNPGSNGDKLYEVRITNITRGVGGGSGQILNGLTVFTHNSNYRLFTLGQPARPELQVLAEDAFNRQLVQNLQSDPNVKDVQHIGLVNPTIFPILPGETKTLILRADEQHKFLSLAAMLVTTNDCFTALNGVPLPQNFSEFFTVGYDGGSEVNNEDCRHIPGPPCNSIGVRVGGGEGYVSIHSGIQGVNNNGITRAERDWRNPVAWITVRRIG